MLNDTTYLLDETFNLLNSIHDYQQEIKKENLVVKQMKLWYR